MDDQILDLREVLERVQDDKELLLELFDIFKEDYGQKRPQLAAFLTSRDLDRFRDTIHSIKGATGNIAAKAMYALCIRMEKLAEQEKSDDLSPLLDSLDLEFARFNQRAAALKQEFGK